ncbi:CBS domain containing-hemolysin-like protein [Streptosporangium becharense]|uniref:CBS domain containing-hemolysin-like protein n=1 Tax=Streptosporangium becharense TaxID=1816182 RepID=A0A7W9MK13_9ACTN|nr:hemolysin family protein [Streptosporangium becharense]MBB2910395.1 CBS domain containing-hemolysin-like protein [Streptosporangium becharense]MBB5823138.1 CBS domain containing-hemolysin-like protein [Streptosporangium becharense]
MNLPLGLALTVALLAGNGFFVAAEFALVAAKRHRLEKAAARGDRAAAAAVKGIRELSLMLAGAQLGITLCSLGLGVVSEPLIAGSLTPLFHAWGLPEAAAHAVAFVIALAVVTFLHMVIGEMAPKSWAIARPERSATILALPFRAFTVAVRPVLRLLNGVSNLLLRLARIQPRDEVSHPRTPAQLRHLVEESRRLGLIEGDEHAVITQALHAPTASIAPLVVPVADIVGVPGPASPQEVIDVCAGTRRTRVVVWDGVRPAGVVHVRDAYLARRRGAPVTARDMAYRLPELAAGTSVSAAVSAMRAARSQLALVRTGDGAPTGLVFLDDLLARLLVGA